jgi:hypothetical protein
MRSFRDTCFFLMHHSLFFVCKYNTYVILQQDDKKIAFRNVI